MPQSKVSLLAAAVFATSCGGDAVSPSPPIVPVPIAWSFCAGEAPVWLAIKDGDAPWVRVTPTTANTFSFTLARDVGAVAYVTEQSFGTQTASFLNVIYASTDQLKISPSVACASGTKTVRVPLNGVGDGQVAEVTLGTASSNAGGIAALPSGVANGPVDLIATLRVLGHGGAITSAPADKAVIRHGLDIPDGGATATVDFAGPEAISLPVVTVNVADATPAGCASATYLTESIFQPPAASQMLSFVKQAGPVGAVSLRAIPPASLGADDVHELAVITEDGCLASTYASRTTLLYTRGVDGRTVILGPGLGAVAFNVLGGTASTARIRADYPVQPEYAAEWTASYIVRPNPSVQRNARVTATAGYSGTARAVLDIPDLASVPGWQDAWGIPRDTGDNGLFAFTATSAVVLPLTSSAATPAPQRDGTMIRMAARTVLAPPPTR